MRYPIILCVIAMMLVLSGCEAIGDIFSAGVYTGLAVVVLVIIIIVWIVRKLGSRD